jgi:hypothetical protein
MRHRRYSYSDFECMRRISRSTSHSEAPQISLACWTAAPLCADFLQGFRTEKLDVFRLVLIDITLDAMLKDDHFVI